MRVASGSWFASSMILLGVCLPTTTYAWGQSGHRFITAEAIPELPAPLKTFFLAYSNQLTNNAAIEPPGTHYIDIDYYPEFLAHTFPRDINVLIARYGGSVVTNNGIGPWTAVGHYENLRSQFAAAQTLSDWTTLLATAATLAHYLEDLHNPMHLATNYNGQYSGQTGLHSRYETTLIQYQLGTGLKLATNVTDCIYYPNMRDALFDDIDWVYPSLAPLLAADLAAFAAAGDRSSASYYQHLWDDGCSSFTPLLMRRAAAMVASAWYSAWRDAGFPQPPGVTSSLTFGLTRVNCDQSAFRFTIIGDAGQKLEVQTSTNLTHWIPEGSVTNLDGRFEVVAPWSSTEPRRYYRAVLVQ